MSELIAAFSEWDKHDWIGITVGLVFGIAFLIMALHDRKQEQTLIFEKGIILAFISVLTTFLLTRLFA